MKKSLSILFLVLPFHFCFSQVKKNTSRNEMDEYIKMTTESRYVVIAGTSSDYNALNISAKQLSKNTGIVYDNTMIYDEEYGMINPKDYDYHPDQYLPRRDEENLITIEMMYFYAKNNDSLDRMKMIIVTGIFKDKMNAANQLKQIQKSVPTTYIKKTELFMGCRD